MAFDDGISQAFLLFGGGVGALIIGLIIILMSYMKVSAEDTILYAGWALVVIGGIEVLTGGAIRHLKSH
jgi:hypothetical protein